MCFKIGISGKLSQSSSFDQSLIDAVSLVLKWLIDDFVV